METIYKKREGNIELRIYQDDDAESPRKHDNLGAFWSEGMHRRYDFHEAAASEVFERIKAAELAYMGNDGEGTEDWEDIDWLRHLQAIYPGRQHAFAIMPVYMYEHSGISFSTAGFTCQWDSGTIGWMLCDHQRWTEYMGDALWDPAVVEQHLRNEVEELDNFHVYGAYYYEIHEYTKCECCGHEEADQLDSCGGFYGPIPGEWGAKAFMKEHLDTNVQPLIEDW